MKNIHILPTDKPTYLYEMEGKLYLSDKFEKGNEFWHNQHIYITSDEEIKNGDWCHTIGTSLFNEQIGKVTKQVIADNGKYGVVFKKIILTTDQELIKDGVQAIDDEFLEWFVKNPSCEKVEVKHKEIIQYGNMSMYDHNGDGSHYFCKDCEVETSRSKEELLKFGVEYYKIIIPKEEPKQNKFRASQEMVDYFKKEQETILDRNYKQETLEEAAETELYQTINKIIDGGKDLPKGYSVTRGQAVDYAFKIALEVAKWQQEKMYSEKDMEEYAEYCSLVGTPKSPKDWFEQFKKNK